MSKTIKGQHVETIQTVEKMHEVSNRLRREGKKIALVPTMGYLHEGHLSLLRLAKQTSDIVVMSLFVNPTQFGPAEDLDKYPRDFRGDLEKAADEGVDYCFAPNTKEMYPSGFQTYVEVEELTKHLCGASRPTHFRGVTTVVMKLFNAVKPHIAIFGQKDYQQLQVIRRMVEDMNMEIKIKAGPIVREHDGLAMSSRNALLSTRERKQAASIIEGLKCAERLFGRGERCALQLVSSAKKVIEAEPETKIDYVELRDPITLEKLERVEDQGLLAAAVFVGKTRLIDNMVLEK